MKILVINSGSSSLKFTLFEMENGGNTVIASGLVERVGTPTPNLIIKRPDGFKFEESPEGVKNHSDGLRAVCAKLVDPQIGVLKSLSEVKAIGHRVLHGGEKITAPVKVDEAVKDIIRECIPLGPLHNPANLSGIEACEEIFAGVPNVAVFDTQFHQTMPPEAYLYAIPMEFYKKYGIRKYGFHGTSHRFVTLSTAEFLGKKPEDITIITCHLGNGCSMAAVKNGKVIDTTMGLTPLEGLMMGTRSGDMDPAAVLRMVEVGNTAKEVDTILNKKSGLLATPPSPSRCSSAASSSISVPTTCSSVARTPSSSPAASANTPSRNARPSSTASPASASSATTRRTKNASARPASSPPTTAPGRPSSCPPTKS